MRRGGKGQPGTRQGIGRYSSTKALLVDQMEVVAKTKYASHWWLLMCSWLSTEVVWLPRTGGRFLSTGGDTPPKTGRNDFEHGKTWNWASLWCDLVNEIPVLGSFLAFIFTCNLVQAINLRWKRLLRWGKSSLIRNWCLLGIAAEACRSRMERGSSNSLTYVRNTRIGWFEICRCIWA